MKRSNSETSNNARQEPAYRPLHCPNAMYQESRWYVDGSIATPSEFRSTQLPARVSL